jgi:hypothetical protein
VEGCGRHGVNIVAEKQPLRRHRLVG